MKKIWLYILCVVVWVVVIARGYYAIKWNIVQNKMYSYLESYGYTEDDIERVNLDLKRSWKSEWQIFVEFKKEPKILYWFTYRDNKIIKDWVAAAKIPHKEFIEYENMFENGELKYDSENEKYAITSNCPKIVENIQILEEWDLWWFDTEWKWIPVWFWWAAFYYLPYDIENFDEYHSLIKWNPEDKYHIWKITVSDNMDWLPALAVLKVEKPTKAEEERERIRLDQNFVSEELIFEQNRYFSAFWNNPDWTLTAESRDIEWFGKRYDVKFYSSEALSWWALMHLFKAWDNYRFLYDELDIRFIKWECDDWIQWNHKKAESKYKIMVFRWDEIYEWCWNTRTEDEIIEKEPEVISPEDEQQIQYLENLVSWDINNNETTQIQENYEVYYDKESDILVIEEENMNTDNVIMLKIWDKTFDVTLEENSATKELIEKLHEWDVIVNAREYWWFEKVGNLGFDLPKADKQITTEPGDLVLYQWNQISLFYESNSWSYTKLWKVQMISNEGLKEILWDWDVTLVFSLLK